MAANKAANTPAAIPPTPPTPTAPLTKTTHSVSGQVKTREARLPRQRQPDRPQSVYLAEPSAEYQVEVNDPLPRRALEVALSGEVSPVE